MSLLRTEHTQPRSARGSERVGPQGGHVHGRRHGLPARGDALQVAEAVADYDCSNSELERNFF